MGLGKLGRMILLGWAAGKRGSWMRGGVKQSSGLIVVGGKLCGAAAAVLRCKRGGGGGSLYEDRL